MKKLVKINPEKDELVFEGKLNHVFFPKGNKAIEPDEFAIFSMKIDKWIQNEQTFENNEIKIKGKPCRMVPDVTYKICCVLGEENPKFGNTYFLKYVNRLAKFDTKENQIDFLSSIISERLVGALLDTYDDIVTLLENRDIEALVKVKGIGAKTALKLCDNYEDTKDYSEIFVELADLEPTYHLINKLVERYHSPSAAVDAVKKDPYQLTELDGIGFKKADSYALKMGMKRDDPRRVRAFFVYYMNQQANTGKSWITYTELEQALHDEAGFIPPQSISIAAKSLLNDNVVIGFENGRKVALKRFYDLEMDICRELIRLQFGEPGRKMPMLDASNWESIIEGIEQDQGYPFSEEQLHAIKLSLTNNLLAITGLAGAGKTSSANGICAIFDRYTIVACALSGKASVRITEATGRPAGTIHRTLCFQNGKFEYNKDNPLPADIVLIDEATMINGTLFRDLLSAIKTGTKVILMGDVQQLTPIGSCQVFSDILNCGVIPIARLTKPHRQALESGIIPTSIHVASGEQIFPDGWTGNHILGNLKDMELEIRSAKDHLQDLIVEHFEQELMKYSDIMEVQICVPRKEGGDLSCMSINKRIQEIYNPKKNEKEPEIRIQYGKKQDDYFVIRKGDKVINQKNNYKCVTEDGQKVPVFNGNIGIVLDINDEECTIDFVGIGVVIFDNKSIDKLALAYACTVHKLQGSGFKSVIVGLDFGSYILNNSELLYTAITRAKKYCVLVGQDTAIKTAIKKKETKVKQTFLVDLLRKAAEAFAFAA